MTQNFAAVLQSLFNDLTHKDPGQVMSKIRHLEKQVPRQPDLLHLKALAHKAMGEHDKAIPIMTSLVSDNQKNPLLHNNLANLYLKVGKTEMASEHYTIALRLKPNYLDAFKNLILLLIDSDELELARSKVESAAHNKAFYPHTHKLSGDLAYKEADYKQAVSEYKQYLAYAGNDKSVTLKLAVVLKEDNQFAEAKSILEALLKQQVSPEILYHLALCDIEMSAFVSAESYLLQALELAPQDVKVHRVLNEMYWQINAKAKFGSSFVRAIEKGHGTLPIYSTYADMLSSAGLNSALLALLVQSESIYPDAVDLKIMHANFLANNGQFSESKHIFEQVITQDKSVDTVVAFVKLLITQGNYDRGISLLQDALVNEPDNQLLWAYLGTCWKMTDPEKYQWLVDPQQFIRPYYLPVPKGFSTLAEFLDELAQLLMDMHSMSASPLTQTLVGGTQTPGKLVYRDHKLLALLKQSYEQVILDYAESLKDDIEHPLLKRKSSSFNITGSWSVKLDSGGFHVNHVHPEGWISSAFYIRLPKNMRGDQHEGCIKFGECPLELGDKNKPDRIVEPKEGMLVLFPSYMWHGTFPFESDDIRLTAPFDVVPI